MTDTRHEESNELAKQGRAVERDLNNGFPMTCERGVIIQQMADRIEELEAKLAQQDDLVQAAVAAALVRAADTVEDWGRLLSGTENVSEEVIGDILALITPDAQAALDRVVQAERERGFWLGRSCGGSKAEIDAALAAIREGGK